MDTERAAAFSALYARHHGDVARLCGAILRDRAEAEDATEEAFAKAWRAILDGRAGAGTYPWLRVVARNHCYDVLRRRKRSWPVDSAVLEAVTPPSAASDRALIEACTASLARESARRIAPSHQSILQLREGLQLSYKEIAEQEAIPLASVESRLYRARRALRREYLALAGPDGLAVLAWWRVRSWWTGAHGGCSQSLYAFSERVAPVSAAPATAIGGAVIATAVAAVATFAPLSSLAPTPAAAPLVVTATAPSTVTAPAPARAAEVAPTRAASATSTPIPTPTSTSTAATAHHQARAHRARAHHGGDVDRARPARTPSTGAGESAGALIARVEMAAFVLERSLSATNLESPSQPAPSEDAHASDTAPAAASSSASTPAATADTAPSTTTDTTPPAAPNTATANTGTTAPEAPLPATSGVSESPVLAAATPATSPTSTQAAPVARLAAATSAYRSTSNDFGHLGVNQAASPSRTISPPSSWRAEGTKRDPSSSSALGDSDVSSTHGVLGSVAQNVDEPTTARATSSETPASIDSANHAGSVSNDPSSQADLKATTPAQTVSAVATKAVSASPTASSRAHDPVTPDLTPMDQAASTWSSTPAPAWNAPEPSFTPMTPSYPAYSYSAYSYSAQPYEQSFSTRYSGFASEGGRF